MNSALIPQQQTRPAAADYSAALPSWINYLIAAYPTANLASRTFAVLEDAFRDEAPATMTAAARLAVRDQKFFPSVHELGGYVRRVSEDADVVKLPPMEYYRRVSQLWPTCPDCGERVAPEWNSCPACVDLAAMQVQL